MNATTTRPEPAFSPELPEETACGAAGRRPMRWVARSKTDQNCAVLDPWTAVHLGSGLAFGLMNLPLGRTLAAALAYEAVEQIVERRRWGRRLFESSGPESLANAVTDTLFFAAGWWLGRRWNATGPAREPRSR